MIEAVVVEPLAYRRYLPVHHRRGRYHVGAGRCLTDRHSRQKLQCGVVIHAAVLDDAAVSVVGELVEADVGDYKHFGRGLLDDADRFLHDAVGFIRLCAFGVFVGGQAKQQHGVYAERRDFAHFGYEVVQRELIHTGHRVDGVSHAASVRYEHGVDEIADRYARLLR